MDFTMQIFNNLRKRCRDEPDLAELHMHGGSGHHPVAKKARQSDADASPRDSAPPASPSESSEPSESGPSTPASIDVDMDDGFRAPEPAPQPQSRPQATIISGWNQAQRDRYLRQGYPLSWMQGTRVSAGCFLPAWLRVC